MSLDDIMQIFTDKFEYKFDQMHADIFSLLTLDNLNELYQFIDAARNAQNFDRSNVKITLLAHGKSDVDLLDIASFDNVSLHFVTPQFACLMPNYKKNPEQKGHAFDDPIKKSLKGDYTIFNKYSVNIPSAYPGTCPNMMLSSDDNDPEVSESLGVYVLVGETVFKIVDFNCIKSYIEKFYFMNFRHVPLAYFIMFINDFYTIINLIIKGMPISDFDGVRPNITIIPLVCRAVSKNNKTDDIEKLWDAFMSLGDLNTFEVDKDGYLNLKLGENSIFNEHPNRTASYSMPPTLDKMDSDAKKNEYIIEKIKTYFVMIKNAKLDEKEKSELVRNIIKYYRQLNTSLMMPIKEAATIATVEKIDFEDNDGLPPIKDRYYVASLVE